MGACVSHTDALILPGTPGGSVILHSDSLPPGEPADWFAIYVYQGHSGVAQAAIQGVYLRAPGQIEFSPDFPFEPGTRYRVDVSKDVEVSADILGVPLVRDGHSFVGVSFAVPVTGQPEEARVTGLLPSSDELPENVLRFYLYFASPMQAGWKDRQVRLLGEDGMEIKDIFMSFKQELWSPDQERMTVLLDPGRIKRGVSTNVRLGPALEVGARYTLVVEAGWPDAHGQVTKERFEKVFTVTPAIRSGLIPEEWTLLAPRSDSFQAVTLVFDRPMDHALLPRMLAVLDSNGREVVGVGEAQQGETQWLFRPQQPWNVGTYTIVVQAELEDVAGNNLNGPLDREATAMHSQNKAAMLEFRVR